MDLYIIEIAKVKINIQYNPVTILVTCIKSQTITILRHDNIITCIINDIITKTIKWGFRGRAGSAGSAAFDF